MFKPKVGPTYGNTSRDCAFSPDKKYALGAVFNGLIHLWDVVTREEVRLFRGHTGPVNQCRFTSDGCYIVSVSRDGTLRLWDVDPGSQIDQWQTDSSLGSCSIATEENGKIVVVAGGKNGFANIFHLV